MASLPHEPTERSRLLSIRSTRDEEAHSIISSAVTKEEEALGQTAVGEILPYKDYSSIDFLHDLVYIHTSISL
jgi:chloride channel 3/4/5